MTVLQSSHLISDAKEKFIRPIRCYATKDARPLGTTIWNASGTSQLSDLREATKCVTKQWGQLVAFSAKSTIWRARIYAHVSA